MNHRLRSRFVLALALLASAALAGGCNKGPDTPAGMQTSNGPGKESSPGKEETSAKADFTLTSEQLAKEFETDKEAALKKYKDKWVEVEGPMENVMVLPSGDVNIRLVGFQANPDKFDFHSVRGIPPETERERLKGLTKGQKVKLKGKVERDLGGFIDLVPCEIVSVGPDPAIAVTADQLTEAYAKDAKDADAKYKDKWLLIEGVVSELKAGTSGADSVILEGAGKKDGKPIRISAAYPADRKNDFTALKKGDKIKVKGECTGELLGTIYLNYSRLVK
jgi:hypothetical protein